MIKQILEMIKAVDQEHTDKLNEIDRLVDFVIDEEQAELNDDLGYGHPQVTRSLDAIKNIQPDGWVLVTTACGVGACTTIGLADGDGSMPTPILPTEELARLHAVLQAIDYERKKECKDD